MTRQEIISKVCVWYYSNSHFFQDEADQIFKNFSLFFDGITLEKTYKDKMKALASLVEFLNVVDNNDYKILKPCIEWLVEEYGYRLCHLGNMAWYLETSQRRTDLDIDECIFCGYRVYRDYDKMQYIVVCPDGTIVNKVTVQEAITYIRKKQYELITI